MDFSPFINVCDVRRVEIRSFVSLQGRAVVLSLGPCARALDSKIKGNLCLR